MNSKLLAAGFGLVVLAGSGFGAWRAWEAGLVGSNPRAPVAAAMERAVRLQVKVNAMSRGGSESCLPVELQSPLPEIEGLAGIAPNFAPGQWGPTLLLEADTRYQPAREAQIAQLDFLASQGLLTRADVAVETNDGLRSGRRYGLTWDGYAAGRTFRRNSICLAYGERGFAGIEKIEKSLERMMDLEVYDVTYRTSVQGIPAWAKVKEATVVFPDLADLIEDRTGHAKLIRTREGWRASHEIELEAAATSRGQETKDAIELMSNLFFMEPPKSAVVAALVEEKIKDQKWISQNGVACLPLKLQQSDNPEERRGGDGRFAFTFNDRADRGPYEWNSVTTTLQLLSALEAAGLAEMQYLEPAGVRYRVSDEAVSALELSSGGRCVPAGRIAVELLTSHSGTGSVQLVARATLSDTPDWVLGLARHLPALRSMIENGLPMTGSLSTMSPKGEVTTQWQSPEGLRVIYPTPAYTTLPPHLVPVMPATAAALPDAPVKAPAFSSAQRVTPMRGVRSAAPPQLPTVAAPVSKASAPPFPADGSPVHVVSIYEAPLPGGAEREFQQYAEGVAQVTVRAPGTTLILGAYEPTQWIIDAPRGIGIRRVIAIGNHDQRVTVVGGSEPEVVTGKLNALLKEAAGALPSGVPNRSDPNSLVDVASITRALTGELPESFQAAYKAPAGGFTVQTGAARFELPAPVRPGSLRGAVGFLDGSDARGLEVPRGRSGAYTDAAANRAFSAGRVYFEGRMQVTNSVSAHVHANIGVCLAQGSSGTSNQALAIGHGVQKLYADGDVFGIAADFDRGRVYVRVNGKWVSGAPGSAGGVPLQIGKQYRACFFSAGTTSGESPRSDTTWRANFGGQRFAYPLPAGYVPYE
ncbi:MAG: hypothetical protein AB7G51_15100 [Steroidobacteraceae bacterium]